MNYLVQFQINVFALLVLFVLFLFVHMSKIKTFGRKMISLVLVTSAVSIVVEPLTWIFDRMLFPGAYFLEYSTNFVLFMIGPIIGGMLMSYVDYRLFRDPQRVYGRVFYQHFSIVTFGLLIINFFTPVYFSINPETNGFSSGEYKFIHYMLLGAMYLFMLTFVIRHSSRISRKEALIYFICFFLPIIGMLIQLIDSKLHFSWTSIALGLLIVYVFLETTPSDEDFLTKLYNRRSFETHMQYLMQGRQTFGLIVFDLNYFKEINDQHGHKMGDEILINFSRALKQTFAKNGLAVRLGGDEFAVILDLNKSDFKNKSDNLNHQIQLLSDYLSRNVNPLISNLSYSYGYQEFEPGMSIDALYSAADQKMYRHKQHLKSQSRAAAHAFGTDG
jgi:diguanylate cyclase (GGDEF)-like protein